MQNHFRVYPRLIKDMPLDANQLYDGYLHCIKVLDSVKDYSKFCREHNINECDVETVLESAIQYCNNIIMYISRVNRILDRSEWIDFLEFWWQPGFKRRARFKQFFYTFILEIQQKIEDVSNSLTENPPANKIGFGRFN